MSVKIDWKKVDFDFYEILSEANLFCLKMHEALLSNYAALNWVLITYGYTINVKWGFVKITNFLVVRNKNSFLKIKFESFTLFRF